MSVATMLWALLPHDDLGPAEQLTLVILADHANPDGCNAFPKVSTLAARRGLSARTVRRHLATLRELGFIRLGDQRWTAHLRADERPTVWDLDVARRPSAAPPDGPEWDPDPNPEPVPEPVDDGVTGLSTDPPIVDNRVRTGVTPGVLQNQVLEPNTPTRATYPTTTRARPEAVDNPCSCGQPAAAGVHHRTLGPCVVQDGGPEVQGRALLTCPHGELRGPRRCALCRNRVPAEAGP